MSTRKRLYGDQGGIAKRMVGGRTLSYTPRTPVSGSFRSLGAISRQSARVGGWSGRSPELKFIDTSDIGSSIPLSNDFTTPGATFLLNNITPGSLATNRIGRKITMKSLYIRATVQLAATSTRGDSVRMIVFYDKQANAATPVVADVLADDSFYSPNNLSNRDRFVVLCDRVFDPIATSGDLTASMEVYKKINLETMFNADVAGGVGDITSGSVYIMFAQQGTILTANPTAAWYARIRYTDV